MKFLPYGRHSISEADIEAVVKVLKSDLITQGPAVESFEKAFCDATGAGHAIACSNGTAALHLAALAGGVVGGDVVIAPAVTFVASANCARLAGAEVVFSDIDRDTLCVSPQVCEQHLQRLAAQGRPAKAVITVDFAGQPCDMNSFARLKQKYGFVWIQDACHAIGASWTDNNGKQFRLGESDLPDFTVFSFHPVKHITCGEGGMVTTHKELFAERMRMLRVHGITRDPKSLVRKELAFDASGTINPWYYEMQELGCNYRMTDFQAALGESQLSRLEENIIRRREIVEFYRRNFQATPRITFPSVAQGVDHAYHLAIAEFDFSAIGKSRAMVMNELKAKGIGTQVHYIPIPLMPYYAETACLAEIPAAMDYYYKALSLPCYPNLSDEDLQRVVKAVLEVTA